MDTRLREVLHLIAYLRAHPQGAHISDVSKALGMSPKSTQDLIALATTCGKAPFDPGCLIEIFNENGRYHLGLDQRLGRPVQFSRAEALALVVALKALGNEGDLGPAAARAIDKLRATLTEQVAQGVGAVESRIAFEGHDAGLAERYDVLRGGMNEGRSVDIVYYTVGRDAISERRIRPYAMLQHLGQWYTVGRCMLRKEIRVFKVERVKQAVLTDDKFEIPSSFKAERYRKKGKLLVGRKYAEAKIRFRDPSARVIREEWPPELIEDGGDGAVVGTMQFVGLEGLANWLLAHGGAAEVVEPAELRDAVAARARSTLALYE